MTRLRRTDVHTLDLANWPTVDLTALNEAARPYFVKAQAAIELYVQNESIGAIEQRTGVGRRQLYRLIDRCLCVHDDGRLFGFRGLIRHSRVSQYQRGSLTHTLAEPRPQGLVGAFTKLLSDYPALAAWLRDEVRQRRVVVEQRSAGGHIAIRIRGLKQAHERFLQQCRRTK